jgi:hypothetical protein
VSIKKAVAPYLDDDKAQVVLYSNFAARAQGKLYEHACNWVGDKLECWTVAAFTGDTSKPRKLYLAAMASGEVQSENGRLRVLTGISFESCRVVGQEGAPPSPEEAVQQMGRAGRDGLPAIYLVAFTLVEVEGIMVRNYTGCMGSEKAIIGIASVAAAKEATGLQNSLFTILHILVFEENCMHCAFKLYFEMPDTRALNLRHHAGILVTYAKHAEPRYHTSDCQ